jgi:hypothetical protein
VIGVVVEEATREGEGLKLIYEITLTPFEVFYYNIMVNINMNYSNKCTINMYSLYH